MERIAKQRSYAYEVLIAMLSELPSEAYIDRIRGKEFREFVEAYGSLGETTLSKGAAAMLRVCAGISKSEKTIEDLAVDRTKLIRVPHKGKFRPPYESQYCEKEKKDGLLSRLQAIYIKSGFVPVDTQDTADFLLIELDFMCRLVANNQVEIQKEFMKNHLGEWVCAFANAAASEAETEYYRGLMQFLEGFIRVESELLK